MKEIYFKDEGRELLFEGVNQLHNAVSTTFGPNGSTVSIPSNEVYGTYKVTKDGVSVANAVKFKHPVMNIGAQLVKQAAQKTVDEAGDGTTTATILATALINNLKNFKSRDVNNALDTIIPHVIEQLKLNSRKLNHEDIKYVASISANNDTVVGDLIQQAYNFSNIVKVEESNLLEDNVQSINGMMLNTTYFHKDFVNNKKKGVCDLNEPVVLLLDGKLEKLDAFKHIIDDCAVNNKSLLIVVEHVHEQVLLKLRSFALNQQLEVCVIKTPGFGPHRKDLLNDLSVFTGAKIITDFSKQYITAVLGKLKSCSINNNTSILTKEEEIDITSYILELKTLLSNGDLDSYDKDLLEQRIEYLTGKVSIIKVGGKTENEMKEKYDRYDDAVKAVACALEEGIVEGGGMALYRVVQTIAKNIIDLRHDSIELKILEGLIVPINILGIPVNIDMFEQNIIDPLKVTRCALENAASVAKTILSTEVIVLSENEWKN